MLFKTSVVSALFVACTSVLAHNAHYNVTSTGLPESSTTAVEEPSSFLTTSTITYTQCNHKAECSEVVTVTSCPYPSSVETSTVTAPPATTSSSLVPLLSTSSVKNSTDTLPIEPPFTTSTVTYTQCAEGENGHACSEVITVTSCPITASTPSQLTTIIPTTTLPQETSSVVVPSIVTEVTSSNVTVTKCHEGKCSEATTVSTHEVTLTTVESSLKTLTLTSTVCNGGNGGCAEVVTVTTCPVATHTTVSTIVVPPTTKTLTTTSCAGANGKCDEYTTVTTCLASTTTAVKTQIVPVTETETKSVATTFTSTHTWATTLIKNTTLTSTECANGAANGAGECTTVVEVTSTPFQTVTAPTTVVVPASVETITFTSCSGGNGNGGAGCNYLTTVPTCPESSTTIAPPPPPTAPEPVPVPTTPAPVPEPVPSSFTPKVITLTSCPAGSEGACHDVVSTVPSSPPAEPTAATSVPPAPVVPVVPTTTSVRPVSKNGAAVAYGAVDARNFGRVLAAVGAVLVAMV